MKPLYFLILLVPYLAFSQVEEETVADANLLYENNILTPAPTQLAAFKQGLKEHNEAYHASEPYGARVFSITNGPYSGKYISLTGPLAWSALDEQRDEKEAHDADWENNVQPYLLEATKTSYWRYHSDNSDLSEDFELSKLLVRYYDVKAGEEERMLKLVDRLGLVIRETSPEVRYTTFTNIFPSEKEGRDLALIVYFNDYAWLSSASDYKAAYKKIYGSRGLEEFLTTWQEIRLGEEAEIWIFEPELSGLDGIIEGED